MLSLWKFKVAECSYHVFIFHEPFVRVLTVKITPSVNNSLLFLHDMKELL